MAQTRPELNSYENEYSKRMPAAGRLTSDNTQKHYNQINIILACVVDRTGR